MVAQEATKQHYDSETGEWDGQLVHGALVEQVSAEAKHPEPALDNTVKTLFFWAMDLDIPHGPRLVLLTILRHIDWKKGDHCIAGIQTLARESQFSTKTLKEHIKFLVAQNLISRLRHIGRTTETRLGTVGVETSPMVGVETSPMVGEAPTPETNSSSTNPINQTDPRVVDAKRVDPPGPGPEPGATDRGLNSFSEEEGATIPDTTPNPPKADVQEQAPAPNPPKAPPSQGITRQATEAFMDGNIAEIPMDHEVEWMLKHCWDWWVYPAHPYGWKHGPEAALKTCTKDTAGRVKFRKDLVDKLMLAGLPKPQEVDADNEWARKVTAEIMDRRIAEDAQTREKGAHCAGCGRKRQLPPGVTHCSPCRKELVEVAAP